MKKHYSTLIFDCDGVVLDSNSVKTRAFGTAALEYGEDNAKKLVDYHVANGGVSRYKKFEYFLEKILDNRHPSNAMQSLLEKYASEVKSGLLKCDVATNLTSLRSMTNGCRWLMISGGDQAELRSILNMRGIDSLFDGGIFGSPDTKREIIKRETASGNLRMPAVFFGDSQYDHASAKEAGIDFVFVKKWTEFKGWEKYFSGDNAPCNIVDSLEDFWA